MAWTTEDVRRYVVSSWLQQGVAGSGAKFDRWLAAHDAEVAREAAERGWSEGARDTEAFYLSRDPQRKQARVLDIPLNPYRKPQPPEPFDTEVLQEGESNG